MVIVMVMAMARVFSEMAFLIIAVVLTAAVLPEVVLAHLLTGNRGPIDAFNYDERQVDHLNADCKKAIECKQTDIKNIFFFNCYYDVRSGECQCSKGDFSKCDLAAANKGSGDGNKGVVSLIAADAVKPFKFVYAKLAALPLLAKVAVLLVVAAAVIFILARLKDNSKNNLRRAGSLHEEASVLHERGNEDEAKSLFEKSNYLREKAYDQMKEKV